MASGLNGCGGGLQWTQMGELLHHWGMNVEWT